MEPFDLRLWPQFKAAGGNLSTPAIVEQIVIDSRRIFSPHTLFVALQGKSHDGHAFISHAIQSGAKYGLVSKNWKKDVSYPNFQLLRVENPLKAFQEIAKTYRQQRKKCKVIAIGGTHGKTMLKDLLKLMLEQKHTVAASPESFNSQIGVPLSLLKIKDHHDLALIEAAFSRVNEMDALVDMINPQHVILTRLAPKHMESLNNLSTIANETAKLLHAIRPNDWAIVPQSSVLQPYLDTFPGQSIYWSEATSCFPHAFPLREETQMNIPYSVKFPDEHIFRGEMNNGYSYFLDLVNMACKAAWLFNIPSKNIAQILQDFTLEPTRTEMWTSPTKTLFINEPYSSDPQSIDRALTKLIHMAPKEKRVFLFGGLKGNDEPMEYRRIGQAVVNAEIHHLMLVGDHPYTALIQEVQKSAFPIVISRFKTANEALERLSKEEQVVLIKGDKKIPFDQLTEIVNDSICTNQSLINLATVESNLKLIRQTLPPKTRVMVIVKALAYGTEDIQMAKFLSSCQIDILGVSYVDEAISLKRAGVKQAVFSLNSSLFEIPKVLKWDIEIGVSDAQFIEALAKEALKSKKIVKIHLHVNTGMSRFGCRPEEAFALAKLIKSHPNLVLEGIMTHFACAEDPSQDNFTFQQIHTFDSVISEITSAGIEIPWKHAANSSAMTRFHLPQYNMVRIGLSLYGLSSSKSVREALPLKLALSLVSRIVGINICKEGETISYGRNYTVEKPVQRIGVLPIGYFDGLHRNYSGKGWVLIHGQKAPMIGNICMDFMMIDLTDVPNAEIGDKVLIFGEDDHGHFLAPEELASQGHSIVHELVTCIGPRIPRIFIHEEI